jgi:dTDP-4-dehydrorhamnose reductase
VFDGTNFMPYKESDVVRPQSVYGHSKLQGEQYALSYNKSMIIRTSWLYSTYGNNFVKTMLRLGKEKAELKVVFDQVGTPTNAADLAACILSIVSKVSNKSLSFVAGKYHYSNEGVCSWYDFAVEIMQIGERTCRILPIETKDYPTLAKRPHYSVLNKSKIKQTYQIKIPYWKESLKKCMNTLLP